MMETETVESSGTVTLRGRWKDKPGVVERLEEAGITIVKSASSADVFLVEGTPAQYIVNQARRANKEVLDIEVYLAGLSVLENAQAAPMVDFPRRSAIEVGDGWVRILDITLARNNDPGPLCPPASRFASFTFDSPTLLAARTIALGVRYGLPVLLEGETATAKTSAIRWVAHLTGNQLTRINLNGQTDTSELVGRYVPSGGLPEIDIWAYKAFIEENADDSGVNLSPETEALILKACAANEGRGRPLTQVEVQQIMANETLQQPQWGFLEGAVPRALREGHWVILDEVNLAEAQVLERLNPVLENPPTMVLTEGHGTRFGGGGGVPVHGDFRMFATMNPASYAGRTALSPAYRDRWRLSSFLTSPGEREMHQMLRRLVFGEQPEVIWRGVVYQADAGESLYPELKEVEGIDELLRKLSVFHASVCAAAGSGGSASIGRTRRERYTFTRRTMLAAMDLLGRLTTEPEKPVTGAADVATIIEDILEALYVSRLQDQADQQSVRTAMRAAGLAQER
ncbi:MAG: hypothetical protein CMH55_01895 [Myxococcales bacterium]|nr:hypothetical protein [Myxococcales bacterium]